MCKFSFLVGQNESTSFCPITKVKRPVTNQFSDGSVLLKSERVRLYTFLHPPTHGLSAVVFAVD